MRHDSKSSELMKSFKDVRSWQELFARFEKQGHSVKPSEELERQILGSMIQDIEARYTATGLIGPVGEFDNPFVVGILPQVYQAIYRLADANKPVDAASIIAELTKHSVADIQREHYNTVLDLMYAGFPSTIAQDCEKLLETHHKRQIQSALYSVQILSQMEHISSQELLDQAEQMIFSLHRDDAKSGPIDMRTLTYRAIDEVQSAASSPGGLSGVPTGLTDLDYLTGGWQNGDLIVIGARPSKGKTGLAVNLALGAALSGIMEKRTPFLFFSIEMRATQIVKRMLSNQARVNSHRLRHGKLEDNEWKRITDAIPRLVETHSFIDETTGLTPIQLRSTMRRYIEQHGIGLVIIDYLQKMQAGRPMRSREEEVGDIVRSLKDTAKVMNVPVIALSQLNRESEGPGRHNRRPAMSQMRESGWIEQEADVILLIHHEPMTGVEEPPPGQLSTPPSMLVDVELIGEKCRDGPTDSVFCKFNKAFSCFEDAVVPAIERNPQLAFDPNYMNDGIDPKSIGTPGF